MSEKDGYNKFLDLVQFSLLNPQMAMLSFLKFGNEMAKNPDSIKSAQKSLINKLIDLSEYITKKSMNKDVSELEIKTKDRRFQNEEWNENLFFNVIKQYYLTMADWMQETLNDIEGLDLDVQQEANFYLRNYINAIHPSNFPMLNPDVIEKTIKEGGENIQRGMNMLLEDLKNGCMTTNDSSYYEVGKNLATTPGKVVYRNSLIELIQYEPTTESVFKTPILFIPPWINKYYILDLTPDESFIKWIVDKGFTVFVVSWVNPDERYAEFGFEDYAREGVIESLNVIYEITKEKIINAIGYCGGGTLLSPVLAALADPKCKIKPKAQIGAVTLLAPLLDFEKAGELGLFMNENYLKTIGYNVTKNGFLDGQVLFNTMSILKANDMIWRYFVNSYMLGEKPAPHSILYWNADSQNITKSMLEFSANALYKNNIIKKKELSLFGVPIDLGNVKNSIYMISMVKDHLVPWKAAYDGMKLFKKVARFVVGGSGHVAGVINPPSRHKYSYWTNDARPSIADEWFKGAVEHAGSWWNDWFEWINSKSGEQVQPRKIKKYLCDAPGMYVKNKFDEDDIISPKLRLIAEKIKTLSEE